MVDRLNYNLLLASVAEFIKSRDDIWNKVPSVIILRFVPSISH